MQKDWLKTNIVYTMIGEEHEKGVRVSFSSIAKNVDDQQINAFGQILESLSNDKMISVNVAETNKYIA